MNFSKVIQKKNRALLPFSWLYSFGTLVHNKLYDWRIRQTFQPDLPVICVGNLSVGGTGKTPMVEYLLRLLSTKYKTATISRGYKRKTTGVVIADENSTAGDIGDEPMQFHTKFPEIKVVVGEKREEAITKLLQAAPGTEVIILDDAFQHRAVAAGLNILLTDFNNLFTDDYYLPAGQLRDLKSSYTRADIIVVTKCPDSISDREKEDIISKICPLIHQSIFFTSISYGVPYHIFDRSALEVFGTISALMVTGIANPGAMAAYLKDRGVETELFAFPDHHDFTQKDIEDVLKIFRSIKNENKIIITTEKDAMRLRKYGDELKDLPVYALPIQHQFLFSGTAKFEQLIHEFVTKN